MSQPYPTPAPPTGSYGAPQFRPSGYSPPLTYGSSAPYPPSVPYPTTAPPRPLQRPAVVTMAATMTVMASLQWICALSFTWLVATAGAASLSSQGNVEGSLYHLLHRFHLRMVEGLAWPLYLIPLLAFFLGFAILAPRPWTRWALTLTGLLSLAWSAWWLHHNLMWLLAPAFYIVVACLILWTPAASQWYRARGRAVP